LPYICKFSFAVILQQIIISNYAIIAGDSATANKEVLVTILIPISSNDYGCISNIRR
jgi:hypothetical protein